MTSLLASADLRSPAHASGTAPDASVQRAARSFPPALDMPSVLWGGGPDELRAQARDHVAAAGACLLDAGDPALASAPPMAALAATSALARGRLAQRPPACPLIALFTGPSLTEVEWHRALEAGACAVIRLPGESSRLLDLLAVHLRERSRARVIGVTGACGGAGASSFAARLAGAAARTGATAVLVDADPCGGGLDLLVEAPDLEGACWEDVAFLRGADGAALRDGLPQIDGVRLLTSREDSRPRTPDAAAVLEALAPLDGVVVADLPLQAVPGVLGVLDELWIIVPSTDHAVRAARRRLGRWESASARIRAIVRRSGPLSPSEVAEELGVELAGVFADSSRGTVPLLDVRRRGADRLCARLLAPEAGPRRSRGGRGMERS